MKSKGVLGLGIPMLLVAGIPATPETTAAKRQPPMEVTIDALEENPAQYRGKTVTVKGEVQTILGPHLFTIDEREWVDLDGETVVLVPAPLVAILSEGAPVTVTGTVRPILKADLDQEWGVFDLDPQLEVELSKRAGIIANRVTSETGRNVAVRLMKNDPVPAGRTVIEDLQVLIDSTDEHLVGRPVNVPHARVSALEKDGGFWVQSGQGRLFVLPASDKKVRVGQAVEVRGVVLAMPGNGVWNRIGTETQARSEEIYVYASHVS